MDGRDEGGVVETEEAKEENTMKTANRRHKQECLSFLRSSGQEE